MESTGVYWIPVHQILEARGFEVVLVPFAEEVCRQREPPLAEVAPGHRAACHLVTPERPAAGDVPTPSAAAQAGGDGRGLRTDS